MHDRVIVPFLRPSMLAMLVALAACSDDSKGGGGGAELEFRGEQPLLPGLELDSGWLPEGLPVAVKTTVTASGAVTVVARASSDGDQLLPIAGSGSLAVEGGLALEVSARVDALSFEDVVESFEYAIAAEQVAFEPFALDMPVSVDSALPAQELGSVPVPGAPGATLVFSVTGGELTTSFAGTCASARAGFGQYTGTLTMGGTVTAAATIEVDIPFVITESYGPFEMDLPIPPIVTDLDLGTRELASGATVDDMGVCSGMGGSTGDDPSAGEAEDSGSSSDAGDSEAESSADEDADESTSAASGVDDSTGDDGSSSAEDPDWPSPFDGGCPSGYLGIELTSGGGAVCLPYCGAGEACPTGATGSAYAECTYNPESSYQECFSDIDCVDTGVEGEFCFAEGSYCTLQPNYCMLGCDASHSCPDAMSCNEGICVYAE